MLSVAHDVLRFMRLPADRVKHVRDRAFNDRRYFVCDKKLAKLGASPLLTSPRDVHWLHTRPADLVSVPLHVHASRCAGQHELLWKQLCDFCKDRRILLYGNHARQSRITSSAYAFSFRWKCRDGTRRHPGRRAWPRQWNGTEYTGSADTGMTMLWRSRWMLTPHTSPARMRSACPHWAFHNRSAGLSRVHHACGSGAFVSPYSSLCNFRTEKRNCRNAWN